MKKTGPVLIVDGDLALVRAYALTLRADGYEVCEASTGREALALAREARPGVVLLGLGLSDMSGQEVCQRLKRDTMLPDVFVALISEEAIGPGQGATGLEIGADDYILKTADPSELLARIHRLARLQETTAALRESERRYRQLTENIREAFWMTDVAKNQMVFVSPAYEQIWGRTCASLYASPRDWLEAIHPEDREGVLQAALTKQVSGQYDEVYRIIRPDGTIRWVHDRAFPVRDEHGKVSRVVGVAEDITRRKEAEEALGASEARTREAQARLATLAHAVESTTEPICITDLQDRFTFVNRAFERTYGYHAAEIMGKHPQILFSPRNPPSRMAELLEQTRAGGWQGEVLDRRKDGTEFPVFLSTSQIKDGEGRVIGLMGVAQDITEPKRAEEQIRLLADAVHSTRELICITDIHNRFSFVNDAVLRTYGYSKEEMLGRAADFLYSPKNPAGLSQEVLEQTLAGGWHGEVLNRRKDGTEFPIWLSTSRVRDEEGQVVGLLGVGRDISEEKRAERRSRSFSQLGHRLGAALTPEQAAGIILDIAADLFNWDASYLVLYSRVEDRITPILAFNRVGGKRVPFPSASVPLAPTPMMRHIIEQGPGLLDGPDTCHQSLKLTAFGNPNAKMASRMYVPIHSDSVVIGILSVQSASLQAYSQDDLNVLQALADHCGGALQRMKVAEALHAAEAKYRGVFENATEGIFQSRPDGRLVSANPALARMFGYDSPERMQAEVTDIGRQIYVDPEKRSELKGLLLKQGFVQGFEAENRRKDGSRIWVSLNAHVVRDAAGGIAFFEGTIQDITGSKQMEKELLEISTNERRRIGHELHDGLGQYLAGIAFRAKALEQVLGADASPHVHRAKELTTLVSNAIRQTRSVARGMDPMEIETCGLAPALQTLAAETSQFFQVSCVFHSPSRDVKIDPQAGLALYRVAQEAIHNAINHGRAQRIEVELARSSDRLCLRIKDDGTGFVTKPKAHTGMGLRVMEYRARSIGAKLKVVSEPKKGVEIRCDLPLSKPRPGPTRDADGRAGCKA